MHVTRAIEPDPRLQKIWEWVASSRVFNSPRFTFSLTYNIIRKTFRKSAGSKSRDSVSQKNSRAQLAADGRHARACHLWRDRHL